MRALIFDLDGTLVDTVYAHVFAWQLALAEAGLPVDGWRVHRRVGMRLRAGRASRGGAYRVYRDPAELDAALDELGLV
jgi:beta-phosphoglucomutase-like phosphatase (HAD superfamily)